MIITLVNILGKLVSLLRPALLSYAAYVYLIHNLPKVSK